MLRAQGEADTGSTATAAATTAVATAATTSPTTTAAPAATTAAPPPAPKPKPKPAVVHVGRPSDRTRLRLLREIGGDISPKSVVSSGTGWITAQNMMYRHTVTVYDARTLRLVRTIPDAVELSRFGVHGHPGESQGAPVEADFAPDGSKAYVTNYSMYGAGFGPEGSDTCSPDSGYDRSYLYRIDVRSWRIDDVYRVGSVPKVVKVTPDGRYALVSNWCSWDLSVVSLKRGRVVRTIPIGAYPRGIVVAPNGRAAYVAIMGDTNLMRVDLRTWRTRTIGIGAGPRALAFSPNGRWIYATLNNEGRVVRLDVRTGDVVGAETGSAPRSLAMSSDGRALYVVNYESGTISKIRTRDMKVLQEIDACEHPIGIAYDAPTARVWAACYGGALLVFRDR